MSGESYGYRIEPVPRDKRIYGFWHNFAIWFGSDANVAVFWAGALLTPALSFKEALAAIIVGVALGNIFMSIVAGLGYETGVPTMVLARGALGYRGSMLVSILNYIQLVGWSAVMIIVGAEALCMVFSIPIHTAWYYIMIILMGATLTIWSILGPEGWRFLENTSVALLLALTVWLVYIVHAKIGFTRILSKPGSGGMSFWLGLDLVIAMPISWVPLVADYARFSRSLRSGFWGTYIGHFLSCALFYIIGALCNASIGAPDPIRIIASYGLGIPAMLIVVFSTLTTGFLDIYSAAITVKNISPKTSVRKHIVIVGVVSTVIALFFPIEDYEWFLLLLLAAFVPLAVILSIDYYIKRYDPWKLVSEKGYWYSRGFNSPAMAAWAAGFILCLLLSIALNLNVKIPLLSSVAFKFGSSIPTIIATAAIYLPVSLARRRCFVGGN